MLIKNYGYHKLMKRKILITLNSEENMFWNEKFGEYQNLLQSGETRKYSHVFTVHTKLI